MGRVALVTGGSRGIGAAISKALKDAGYTVAANYAGNDEAAKKFTDETGIKTYKWSVADYDACAAGIKQVEADLGPVEVLVNNAGITRDAMFHKMTPAAVEGGHRHQPHRRLQHDPPGLGAACATASSAGSSPSPRSTARRARRARRTTPPPRPATSASPGRWRRRARAPASPSTSIAPGLHRHRDGDGDRREGAERVDHPADPGRPPRRAGGDRAHRRLPRLRRRRLHHRLDDLGQRRPVLRLRRRRRRRQPGFGRAGAPRYLSIKHLVRWARVPASAPR